MDGIELRKKLKTERNYIGVGDFNLLKIEDNMLERTASLLRMNFAEGKPEEEKKKRKDYNEEKVLEQEQSLEQMKEMVDNYKMPELMLYIMWNTHTDWILDNIDNTDLINSKDTYKFAPFALLDWNTVNKQYFCVLAPIFDAMQIEYDPKIVQEKFQETHNKFMNKNEINSPETFKKKMKENINELYPELVAFKNCKDEKIVDILHNEQVINNMSNQIEKRDVFNIGKKDSQNLEDDFCR